MKDRAEAVIVDLEGYSLPQVQQLCRAFPEVPVVCTHSLPDENRWAALSAGAVDCFYQIDVLNIVKAVHSNALATAL
jgi:hypothetical protein